jgi:hypothetical protein
MPSGIVMQSSSVGATKEAIEKVLTENGYETEQPAVETPADPVEPKRGDFETDEAFETAQEEFETKQQEKAEQEEEERERREAAARPKPTRKQKAIEKATRELREQNRKLEERLAALEGKKPAAELFRDGEVVRPLRTRQSYAVEPEIKVPERKDFKTDAEFDEAIFDYRYQVRRAKEVQRQAQEASAAQLKENFENYQSAVADFKEEHDDWDEVVNKSIPIHESVYLAVMELENGPDVTYYLGKHPDYARRLAEMTPLSAAMEVGRLSTRLKTGAREPSAAGDGARQKPRTRLPEPVKPVSTAATSSTLTSSEAAKKRDFRAFKAAQRAGR